MAIEHDWVDTGQGLVTCVWCPVHVTPAVRDLGLVPECIPDDRCVVDGSPGYHEITTNPRALGTAFCVWCGATWEPAA
jgi:hypothetical protein